MSSAQKKRSSSKKAAQEAASSAEKPMRNKSKSTDSRKAAAPEPDHSIADTKNRAKITVAKVENVSQKIILSIYSTLH